MAWVQIECCHVRSDASVNDFSNWFRNSLERERLAELIKNIDIYFNTLEDIREIILKYVKYELKSPWHLQA